MKLIRTKRLNDRQIKSIGISAGHENPQLVQSFIDTGQYATCWRVLTLFARPLYSMKSWSPVARPDLTASDAEIEAAIIEPKHPELKMKYNINDMRALAHEPDILDFAIKIADAFPRRPLLGIDIVREASTPAICSRSQCGGKCVAFLVAA